MAHECPECYMMCYCGGDIDDCLFNFDEDVEMCEHCLGKERDEWNDFDDADHEQTEIAGQATHPIGSISGDGS